MYVDHPKGPRDPYADADGNPKQPQEFPTTEKPVVWEREKQFTTSGLKYEVAIDSNAGDRLRVECKTAQRAIDLAEEVVRFMNAEAEKQNTET